MSKILNTAFYYFFEIEGDVEQVRREYKSKCVELELMGTILIAREGVNVMVSGTEDHVENFKDFLRKKIGLDDLFFKDSWSDYQPFLKMLVKAKDQLIPVNDPSIKPAEFTGPRVSPEQLKQWYDEGKDMVILDTRNEFEFNIGTFENATHLNIEDFRAYEDKLQDVPKDWKEKTVVTFCTGGIRCEKASPLMLQNGFKDVYQLDGGILNYFEKVGGDHYDGDCFVFDRRIALKPNLEQSDVIECFQCRHPLTPKEQQLPSYRVGESCCYCINKA